MMNHGPTTDCSPSDPASTGRILVDPASIPDLRTPWIPTADRALVAGHPARRSFWSYSRGTIETGDGWRLAVHRLHPLQPDSPVPVIMVPGHATTAWTLFAGLRGGIGGALAAAGRDVWVLDPRGSGDSRPARRARRGAVSISDKLAIDLPAFIAHVRRVTGSVELDAVGHSLGGVLLYLHALSTARSPFRRVVTIGSPVRISHDAVPPLLRTRALGVLARRLGRVRLSGFTNHLTGRGGAHWMPIHFDPAALDSVMFNDFLANGIADVYGPELDELIRWVRTGEMTTFLGSRQLVRDTLPMPTLMIVGAADKLTTPEAVRHAFGVLGGAHGALRVVGIGSGSVRDYRHTDTLVGARIHHEIVPLVGDWLGRMGAEPATH